jgi:hypothetical protein
MAALALLVVGSSVTAQAGTVVLKRAWVNKYRNRATVVARFIVDKAHPKPNAPAKDGDMHIAGRADEDVGLPMVAEIMNAGLGPQTAAVTEVHAREKDKQSVTVVGAWRVWFEHPATDPQVQFDTVDPATTTNPDHCFEIHPVATFSNDAVGGTSFIPVDGYQPYDAQTAFGSYEKLTFTLQIQNDAVALTSPKTGHNYAHFYLSFLAKPQPLADPDEAGGYIALADVYQTAGADQPEAAKVRMIFVPGTKPAQWVKDKEPSEGDVVHVLGIPRVNLDGVASFVDAGGSGTVRRKLPYEIIVVGIMQ